MIQYTGDYNEYSMSCISRCNPLGEFILYTFTPRPLMGGGFFALDDELSSLLFMAHRQIGVLEGMIKYIPDIEIIRELMIMKECYYNKLIDYGGDRLSKMLKAGNMGKNDMQETKNIVAAYEFSFGQNISSITLSKICKIALHGLGSEIIVREREDVISLTGAFSNLKEYNPTAPQKILPALADIAAYLLNDEKTDMLAKASLVHYQFEMIHPFQRYNGIVGRIIFPMILYAHGIQSAPFWGLSEFLYFNKNDYFDILSTTQYSGGYIALIKYFVRCIYISAKRASSQIEELVQIITEDESKINAGKTSKITWIVYNYFKRHLVSEIKPISEAFAISYNTVAKIVNDFLEMNILAKDDQQSRHRNFVYSRFMSTLFSVDAQ